MNTINYGIDLGTTNSGIAKFENGKVTIFKNPIGFKDTTPSVVSFKKGRLLIGEKARDLLATGSGEIFTSFKRKMGTDEVFNIESLEEPLTPIDLSSYILKEILSFETNKTIQTSVITIPASFDTIQSNATKKAGYLAGLKEVVLLQEPIAACLAYSNFQNLDLNEKKKWIVYDFGGGTFDVALIDINDSELNIIDHQGNNFLGGVDLDYLVIEKIFCPKIEEALNINNVWNSLISNENSDYKKLFNELLFKAEEAKKTLSLKNDISIEIDFDPLDLYLEFDFTKSEFEKIVELKFNESFHLLEKLLVKNNLEFTDIERIILVGGTTYIPYIKEELNRRTNVLIDNNIDPTTAIIAGAAFYAGNKISTITKTESEEIVTENEAKSSIEADIYYENSTKVKEELIQISCSSLTDGFYRIIRLDGGFDTGINPFNVKVQEFVPLIENHKNSFKIQLFDSLKNNIYTNESIQITNGLYNINGQPLPNDIALEIDDISGKTQLERIFKKNDLLPIKKTLYKTVSKSILKNSDDKLIINVLEGDAGNSPGSNLIIGNIEIGGEQIENDIIKGTDIELNFKISESRDLIIELYIDSINFELKQVFNPHQRNFSFHKFSNDISESIAEINEIIEREQYEENYAFLAQLNNLKTDLINIQEESEKLVNDVSTDNKYRLDELKRIILQDLDLLLKHRYVFDEITNYKNIKSLFSNYEDKANELQRNSINKIFNEEKHFLNSNNKYIIKTKAKELENILDDIYYKQDDAVYSSYYFFKFKEEDEYKDRNKFNQLIKLGDKAVEKNNIQELRALINQLYNLMIVKPKTRSEEENFDGNLGLK